MTLAELLISFLKALASFTWGNLVMLIVGALLIYLGIRYRREPLLIPLGFGCLLANLGFGYQGGFLKPVFDFLISSGFLPILVLAGLGAMLDYKNLFGTPKKLWISLAAQVGVFLAFLLALAWKLPTGEAAGLAGVGTGFGPVAIFVAARSAPRLLPAIAFTVYLLGLVIEPLRKVSLRLLVPASEWMELPNNELKEPAPRKAVLFPIGLTLVLGILFPAGIPLIGAVLFGNLLAVSGTVEKLLETLRNPIYLISNLLLGLFLGLALDAGAILNGDFIKVLVLGSLGLAINILVGIITGRVLGDEKRMDLRWGLPGSGAEGLLAASLAGGALLVVAELVGR